MLIIEGTKDDTNGDLRQGFSKLLEQKLKGNMPRIVMGEDTNTSIKKFINNKNAKDSFLLIDLDKPENCKNNFINEKGLKNKRVYFMIQEMEAWFLSQPNILDDFYQADVSKLISKKHAKEIENPSGKLKEYTKNTNKGWYHKVRHGVELLMKLDLDKLMNEFNDVKCLIDDINQE